MINKKNPSLVFIFLKKKDILKEDTWTTPSKLSLQLVDLQLFVRRVKHAYDLQRRKKDWIAAQLDDFPELGQVDDQAIKFRLLAKPKECSEVGEAGRLEDLKVR